MNKSITLFLTLLISVFLILCGCSSHRRVDGWYPVADHPDNLIIGKPLVTVKDFGYVAIVRDTFIIDNTPVSIFLIQGQVKPDKRQQWADGTEQLIGKKLGFVYNDSVITAPRINIRIESGSFQINSPDTILLKNIYNSILQQIK